MGTIGHPLQLVERPRDLSIIKRLEKRNHFLAVLISSVRRKTNGDRDAFFTTREVKHLARICETLKLHDTVTSIEDFDSVETFWDMIDAARKMQSETFRDICPSAVYAVCYFFNKLRLTAVFSKEFKEDVHTPYFLLGKRRLLEILSRTSANRDSFVSIPCHPGHRYPACVLDCKSDYLRSRLIKTLRTHRVCDTRDSTTVEIVEGFEGMFRDPENIRGYEDFTSTRFDDACKYISTNWPDDVKAREYRFKLLFDVWSDIILDYPKHDFFAESYLYNTELILNGYTALNLAKGYQLVIVGLNEEIEPIGLIQFVVTRNELRTASGRRYCQRSFNTTMIEDRQWRKALVNYAAHCIMNGNRAYVHVVMPLKKFIEKKKKAPFENRYHITGEDMYWFKMQLYHDSNIMTSTKASRFNAIKMFLRYSERMGYITVEPRAIKRIKSISTRYEPKSHSLSMREIEAIDKAFDALAPKGLHFKYSKIIFHIQLNSEARIGEICSILIDTIRFNDDGTCSIYEKIKNNGRDMMYREYNTLATNLIRQALDLSRETRQRCPIEGPAENVFLYTNDHHCSNHFAIMDVNRYNEDLKEACMTAGLPRYSSGNVRDTMMTARKKLARKVGLTEMETNAFVGHVEKMSTNSYLDLDFRDLLEETKGINIGTKK